MVRKYPLKDYADISRSALRQVVAIARLLTPADRKETLNDELCPRTYINLTTACSVYCRLAGHIHRQTLVILRRPCRGLPFATGYPYRGQRYVLVTGLVIDKVRQGARSYCRNRMIVDVRCHLRCDRHAHVKCVVYFLVRMCSVESANGRSMWCTLVDQRMTNLLYVNGKDLSVTDETIQTYRLNSLIGTRVSLIVTTSQRNGYVITPSVA